MNPQELFIDVSSGRFLDGESSIPTQKPIIYGDETRTLNITLKNIRGTSQSPRNPSQNSEFLARIGTTSLKLSDGTNVSTANPILINATGTVITSSAKPVIGTAAIDVFTPVTATITATIDTTPSIPFVFKTTTNYVTPVTATITAGITTAPLSTSSEQIYVPVVSQGDIFGKLNPNFDLRILSLSANYSDPLGATFNSTVSDGSVTTIGIVFAGRNFPNGEFDLSFAVCAGAVTAQATAVASGGKIISVSLIDGGSGYSSAPGVSLFTPERTITSVSASNSIGIVNGRQRFTWAYGLTSVSTPQVPIRFSAPDSSITTVPASVPSAFLNFVSGNTWEINFISSGYGYTSTTATVTHDDALVSTSKISIIAQEDSTLGAMKFVIQPDYTRRAFIQNGGAAVEWKIDVEKYGRSTNAVDAWITPTDTIYTRKTVNGVEEIYYGSQARGQQTYEWVPIDYESYLARPTNIIGRPIVVGSTPNLGAAISGYRGQAPRRQDYIWISIPKITNFANYWSASDEPTTPYLPPKLILTSPDGENPRIGIVKGDALKIRRYIILSGQRKSSLPNPEHEKYSNKINRGAINGKGQNISHAIMLASTGAENKSYYVKYYDNIQNLTSYGFTEARAGEQSGGGIFEPTFEILDYGKNYTSLNYDRPVIELSSLIQGQVLYTAKTPTTISIIQSVTASWYNSAFSILPTIVTAPTKQGIAFIVANPGFGFDSSGAFVPNPFNLSIPNRTYSIPLELKTGVTTAGNVITASIVTKPAGYLNGKIPLNVQSPPPGGKAAVLNLNITGNDSFVSIDDFGYGYTSSPIVTAPSPDGEILNGSLKIDSVITGSRIGYLLESSYNITTPTSPTTNGSANLSFKIVKSSKPDAQRKHSYFTQDFIRSAIRGQGSLGLNVIVEQQRLIREGIVDSLGYFLEPYSPPVNGPIIEKIAAVRNDRLNNARISSGDDTIYFIKPESVFWIDVDYSQPGYGYITAPSVVTGASPDQDIGEVTSVSLTNIPIGYENNTVYPLSISTSPVSGGTARAELTFTNNVGKINLLYQGIGYLTPPIVTAPAPDKKMGAVLQAFVTCAGIGVPPGIFNCSVSTAPIGGQTAEIQLNVNADLSQSLVVICAGSGYVTTPIITSTTPPANVINSISITCAGSYYIPETAIPALQDSSGRGCVFGEPIVRGGKIEKIPVVCGGYLYSDSPIVFFNSPTIVTETIIPTNAIRKQFNITTASANAILTTANERDVLLEVYETDGVNEQVITQAQMTLKKRVLE